MLVYRICRQEEFDQIIGDVDFSNIGRKFTLDDTISLNSHDYEEDGNYLHFFKELSSIIFLADLRLWSISMISASFWSNSSMISASLSTRSIIPLISEREKPACLSAVMRKNTGIADLCKLSYFHKSHLLFSF